MSVGIRSAVYVGSVAHQRVAHPHHRFVYPLFMWLLDLEELPALGRRVPGFGYNCARPVAFLDSDHFEGTAEPVGQTLRRVVEDQGLAWPGGAVRVLTHCRILGYVFNPVTFWYCFRPEGPLDVVVAEVNNTFGQRHCYVAGRRRWESPASDGPQDTVRWRDKKVFHVSPFLSLDGSYDFALAPPGDTVRAHIDLRVAGTLRILTGLSLQREVLTATTVARLLVRYPFMTARVVGRIHWEALRLWWKGAPYHAVPPYDPEGAREGVA